MLSALPQAMARENLRAPIATPTTARAAMIASPWLIHYSPGLIFPFVATVVISFAICKSIAEAHQGFIELVSEPGKGTQVTLTLPETTRFPPRVSEPNALAVPGV